VRLARRGGSALRLIRRIGWGIARPLRPAAGRLRRPRGSTGGDTIARQHLSERVRAWIGPLHLDHDLPGSIGLAVISLIPFCPGGDDTALKRDAPKQSSCGGEGNDVGTDSRRRRSADATSQRRHCDRGVRAELHLPVHKGVESLLGHHQQQKLAILDASLQSKAAASHGVEGWIRPGAVTGAREQDTAASLPAEEEARFEEAWANHDAL